MHLKDGLREIRLEAVVSGGNVIAQTLLRGSQLRLQSHGLRLAIGDLQFHQLELRRQ